jgi:heterotetrameric sarcosine oxidase gamma subunit
VKLQAQSVLDGTFGSVNPISRFKSQKATLTELSDTGCVLFTMASHSDEAVHSVSNAAGVELPVGPGEIKTAVGRAALWLSPRSWLIQCRIEDEPLLVTGLNTVFPDELAHAVPFTDALCWLELSGEAALDLLTEGSFISLERGGLPVGHAKRTLIAQIAAVVVRQSESVWQVAVERSRSKYFVDWLSASAGESSQ